MCAQTKKRSAFLIVVLGLLNALTPFSIDLYLPAFPEIAKTLGVEVQRVSLSVTSYFLGFAVGQLLYGPLLDRFGRKPPILIGLVVYLLATLGCMSAQSLEALLVFRFLSALGGSAASVGATAMVRDYFPPQDAAKVFSRLMLVLSVSPLFAPSLGSLVVGIVGWRVLFGMLALLAVLDIALVVWALPYVYKPDRSVQLRAGPILREFVAIARVPEFLVPTMVASFSFAGLFVYVAGSPAIFMEGFGVSARAFGMIFAVLVAGMIGGGQLNQFLTKKYSSLAILVNAVSIQAVAAVVFLGVALMGSLDLYGTIGFLFLILTSAGIAYPNGAALALSPFTKNLGSASALLGFLQLGLGAAVAALLGVFEVKGVLATAIAMGLASATAWLMLTVNKKNLIKKGSNPKHTKPVTK